MTDPATALTRHDEDHGHYTDRPTPHDQLTAGMHGALVEMFDIRVGHTMGGDFLQTKDDAKTLARVADAILGQRVRELEAEVDRLRAYLAYATHFDVCGIEVYPQGDAWMCRGASGIDEHDGPYEALDHARQRAGVEQ